MSATSGLNIFINLIAQNIPTSENTKITASLTTIYDMGGASSGILPNADGSITISPTSSANMVAVMPIMWDIDDFQDYIEIYNGSNITSPILKRLQGGMLSGNIYN